MACTELGGAGPEEHRLLSPGSMATRWSS